MFDEIADILSNQIGIPKSKITMDSDIIKDLGADSLDVVELMMNLEDRTGKPIPDDKIADLKTVGDVVRLLETL